MKKITGFKQEGDQIDGSLDRANELNSFVNRFSSESSSASSPPPPRPSDLHPPWTHSFTVTSQLSHLPPQSWICCCSIVVSNHIRRCWGPLHLHLPPVCVQQSGEETSGETEQEQGCWSRWCQSQSPEGLGGPAMLDSTAPLQHQSQEEVPELRKTS